MRSKSSNKFPFYVLIAVLIVLYLWVKLQSPSTSITESNVDLKADQIISGQFDESKIKSNEEWKNILTKDQYYILREAGTEIPFTGALDKEYRPGTYYSHGCDVPLFRSETKYDSKTGWPSFTAPIAPSSVVLRVESNLDGGRVEVLDPCGGHLGHLFEDGPPPLGKRYCMNSLALRFVPDSK